MTESGSNNRKMPKEAVAQLRRIGLTPRQIFWLKHSWQLICDAAAPDPTNRDVRSEFAVIKKLASEQNRWMRAGATPTGIRTAKNIAFGHLNLVARDILSRAAGPEEEMIPRWFDLVTMARVLEEICKEAERHYPPGVQKKRKSFEQVVALVVNALRRDGHASREQLKRFKVSRSANAPFLELLEVVLGHAAAGPTKDSVSGAETAIRQYLRKHRLPY